MKPTEEQIEEQIDAKKEEMRKLHELQADLDTTKDAVMELWSRNELSEDNLCHDSNNAYDRFITTMESDSNNIDEAVQELDTQIDELREQVINNVS